MNFVYMGLVLLFIVPFALSNYASLPTHWGNIFWAGLFDALASALYILALFRLDVGSLGPLFNVRAAFAVALGFIFLGERLSGYQLFLVGLLFVGGILVTTDKKISWRSLFSTGGIFALLAMLAFAAMAAFIKISIADIGFWSTTLWMQIIAQVFLCATIPLFVKDIAGISKNFLFYMLGLTVFDVIGAIASNKAYGANVGITAVSRRNSWKTIPPKFISLGLPA